MTGKVTVERAGPLAIVEWERPPLQVFDTGLLYEAARAVSSEQVRSAHALLLKGAGHRWSAGLAVEDHQPERLPAMLRAFRGFLEALWDVPGPTVAQVEGPCLGGGLEILTVCDLAFAAESATFGQPEVRLGVFPPFAAAQSAREIGPKATAELLYLGETLPAGRAEALGLVNHVVPDDQLPSEIERVTRRLAKMRREALWLLKKSLRASAPFPAQALDRALEIYSRELMALPSPDEGLRAFLEKRAPVWPVGVR